MRALQGRCTGRRCFLTSVTAVSVQPSSLWQSTGCPCITLKGSCLCQSKGCFCVCQSVTFMSSHADIMSTVAAEWNLSSTTRFKWSPILMDSDLLFMEPPTLSTEPPILPMEASIDSISMARSIVHGGIWNSENRSPGTHHHSTLCDSINTVQVPPASVRLRSYAAYD